MAVRESIRNGTLVPGELYSVYRLAEDLKVSRSPVRDALLRLAETGIVRFERNRGFRVVLPSPPELAEIIDVRLSLEVPAAGRAALRATPADCESLTAESDAMQAAAAENNEPLFMLHDQRLHALILEIAANRYATRIIGNLRDATRLAGSSTVEHQRSLLDVHKEHLPIIKAIQKKDARGAALAMKHHLLETGTLLLREAIKSEDGAVDEAKLLQLLDSHHQL
jgi:DNA-binding GntR family transcriptional regulator